MLDCGYGNSNNFCRGDCLGWLYADLFVLAHRLAKQARQTRTPRRLSYYIRLITKGQGFSTQNLTFLIVFDNLETR